ncbi:MAG TPA: HD domain-containing protein [Tepidisphaeraceae bacterium]|jgi:exopolyphosphatase/pppGpp-phosphohydrolase|nr:HD domain-containing protein [Tepidisphaeraceae bacterium]
MNRPGTEGQTVSTLAWIQNWVFDHLGDVRHERRVASIAASLVDLTFPLHDLTRADVRLLKMAALVHDVGRSVDNKNHPSVGARMIRRNADIPVKKEHRRALAYLTLRHRGAVPAADDPALRRRKDGSTLRLLLGFLRAADALDSRRLATPTISLSRRGRRIRIVCRLREDSAEARRIFSRRKKFRLLEEMLDCHIEVAVIAQRRLRAVA